MVRGAALLVAVLSCAVLSRRAQLAQGTEPALCPAGCYCGDSLDFEVSCRAGDVWVTLEVRRHEFLRVTCDNSTADVTWQQFPPTAVLRGTPTPAVSISECRVPRGSYGDVVHALGGRPDLVRTLHVAVPAEAGLAGRAQLAGLAGLTSLSLNGAPPGPPADLLEELPALTTLRLTNTDLKLEHDRPILRGADRLVTLEVGEARLAELPDGALTGLARLRRLVLWAVGLRVVGADALRGAGTLGGGLRELQLSGNEELRTLPRELLRAVPVLRRLALHDNALGELPRGLLDGLGRLRELRLSDNRGKGGLQLPRGLCADLGELTELRVDRSGLQALPDDVLHGARALRELHLTGNKLTELPRGLLRDQTELRVLRLDANRLSELSADTFSTLAALEELSLDGNRLGVLPASLVSGAGSLRVLSARHAGLNRVTAGSLRGARRLRVLLLSHNNLTLSGDFSSAPPELGPSSSLGPLPELRVLDLSHNAVSEVFSDWRLSMLQLQLVNLTHNRIGPLQYSDVQFLSENVTVDLRHNLLTDLDLSQLEMVGVAGDGGRGSDTTLLLDQNPVECGCGLLGALRMGTGGGGTGLRLEWGGARCVGPPGLRGEPVRTLSADRITCELPTPACPDGCLCDVRPALSRLELRCNVTADGTWPSLPRPGPLGLRDVTATVTGAAPSGRMPPVPRELSSLVMSGLGLRSLQALPPLPATLHLLDLSHNELSRPRPELLRALLSGGRRVYLAGNTLACSCPDLLALTVLQEHARQIPMFSSLRCADGSLVSSASGVRLCGRGAAWVWAVGLAGMAGLGLGALLWAARREVRALLVVRCGFNWLRPRDELDGTDRGRDYDVFVSHAHQDEELALQLADRLEGGGGARVGRRLLLHFRDWHVGESIPEQIARSVRTARRTLVLVSPAYLASSWAALELREALLEPARLLAVVAGAPAASDLSSRPELRGYLAQNTYLRWGDPWFWEKLELALPPPRPASHAELPTRAPAAARAAFIDRLPGLLTPYDKPPPADITPL